MTTRTISPRQSWIENLPGLKATGLKAELEFNITARTWQYLGLDLRKAQEHFA